jgi:Tfp pilus assembly protein PilN
VIELNLLEKKEPMRLPVVLGVDLNELNLFMIGVAMVVWFVPQMILDSYIETTTQTIDAEIAELRESTNKAKEELAKHGSIKDKLKLYQDQVEKLKERSLQVDELLKIRTNPKKVLEKIARSIPEDVWLDDLKINGDGDVNISGGTTSSRSLGEFITIINDSPFFAGSITPTKQENKQDALTGVSYDIFELKGKIKSYDMRVK